MNGLTELLHCYFLLGVFRHMYKFRNTRLAGFSGEARLVTAALAPCQRSLACEANTKSEPRPTFEEVWIL